MTKIIVIIVSLLLISGIVFLYLGEMLQNNEPKQYFNQKEENLITIKMPVSGIITPHHLVAKNLIEKLFAQTAKDNESVTIDRIVLISPNHFHVKGGDLIVANENISQNVVIDMELANTLNKKEYAYINNNAFKKEHGIQGLIPFVDKYFPDVKVLPLMIEDGTGDDRLDKLADYLVSDEVEGNTLLILSSDFSHELTSDISGIHDIVAIDAIENFDLDKVHTLDTDCLGGLRLIMQFSKKQGYENFELLANSSSSEVYNNFFIGENTSYVTGQFKLGQKDQNQKRIANMLFGGDVMLDRTIRTTVQRLSVSYFTDKIHRIFWAQDINMVNIEGPITDNISVSNVSMDNSNHFKFTFSKEHTKEFCDINRINMVSIGNNHILNFGRDGLKQTQEFLEENDIDYVGVPEENAENIVFKDMGGRKIAFVAYNDFAPPSLEKTIELVEQAKQNSDFTVVYPHWGQEYNKKMTKKQRDTAHLLIDAGADLIIGAHPHVIEPVEIYKNKVIFYSLGNFVFDQYFNDDVRERMLINVMIDENDEINFVLTPLWTNQFGQLELADATRREKILKEMSQNSIVSDEIREDIHNGGFDVSNQSSVINNTLKL